MFYVDQKTTPVERVEDARAYQRNMMSFLYSREIKWPHYGSRELTNITAGGFENVLLPQDLSARCQMINEVLLDPANGV
jgi:hypothetical protein